MKRRKRHRTVQVSPAAADLGRRGRFQEAIKLLKQAVTIDPRFAAAYLDLSNFSANSMDSHGSNVWLQKAYEVRDSATDSTRLYIVARYQTEVTGDLYASRRNAQAWIDLYPRSKQAWSARAIVDEGLGDAADELIASQHLMQLAPDNSAAIQQLIKAQIRVADFAKARATCELAIRENFDDEAIRYNLLRIGHLTHDPALVAAQVAWTDAHPDSPILLVHLALYAQNEGRMIDAEKLFDRSVDAFRRRGTEEAGYIIRQDASAAYSELGEPDLARKQLQLRPVDPDDFNALLALSDTGQPTLAAKLFTATNGSPSAIHVVELAVCPSDSGRPRHDRA